MQVAIPYHAGDFDQMVRWLEWNRELGGTENHSLFLMPCKGVPSVDVSGLPWAHVEFCIDGYGLTSDWNGDPTQSQDASGPNSMFRQFAWFFEQRHQGAWMFCEPDAIPTRATWLNEIDEDYRECVRRGKRFMGAIIIGVAGQYATHCTGNMVLPQDAAYCMNLMMPQIVKMSEGRTIEMAFDVAGSGEILPFCHETKLIQQIFRGPSFATQEDLARIRSETALFHTSKDGSLIERLREKRRGIVVGAYDGDAPHGESPAAAPASPVVTSEPKIEVMPNFGVVHAFYDKIGNEAEQEWLLARWADTWRRKNGWSPKVIGLNEAKGHSHYAQFETAFRALPTVNPPAYEFACWIRWLAMVQVGGGLMVDYDVMAYDWLPKDCPMPEGEYPSILTDRSPCPCVVIGTALQYENMANLMRLTARNFVTEERGQPHISDQHFIQAHEKMLNVVDICQQHGKPEAETAKLVHYSSGACQGRPRSEIIPAAEEKRDEPYSRNKRTTPIMEFVSGNHADSIALAAQMWNADPLSAKDHVQALAELAKRDGFAKGRIIRQLRIAGLLPKKK